VDGPAPIPETPRSGGEERGSDLSHIRIPVRDRVPSITLKHLQGGESISSTRRLTSAGVPLDRGPSPSRAPRPTRRGRLGSGGSAVSGWTPSPRRGWWPITRSGTQRRVHAPHGLTTHPGAWRGARQRLRGRRGVRVPPRDRLDGPSFRRMSPRKPPTGRGRPRPIGRLLLRRDYAVAGAGCRSVRATAVRPGVSSASTAPAARTIAAIGRAATTPSLNACGLS
jgi:hypothetical protein